ncbi:MAG: cupin domain-containing protein [Pseudomonadota bacterium]
MTADEVIARLGLEPHPEGGAFRETFRDTATDANGRAASTAIYFLLKAGETSRWHTVDAVEIWHWYAGDPLALGIAAPGARAVWLTLGPDLGPDLAPDFAPDLGAGRSPDPKAAQHPQAVVPAGHWQSARAPVDGAHGYALVGCTVAPGFTFEGFTLAPEGFEPG